MDWALAPAMAHPAEIFWIQLKQEPTSLLGLNGPTKVGPWYEAP